MNTKEAKERVRVRFDKWGLDEEDLSALQELGLVPIESDDERIRKALVELVYSDMNELIGGVEKRLCVSWLEKHKEGNLVEKRYVQEAFDKGMRVGMKQKPAEWSEEDERMLSRCIKSVECSKRFANSETYKAAKDVEMNWLNLLPQRFNLQPKQEWSEENEKIYNEALDALYYKDCNDKDDVLSALKGLCDLIADKRKVIPPYQRWKPSKEQMEALKNALGKGGAFDKDALKSLYDDLKKQM